MLREGRKSGFRTVTVGGVVSGLFAVPLRRRLGSVELRYYHGRKSVHNVHSHRLRDFWARKFNPAIL